jgi:hypothetical protein
LRKPGRDYQPVYEHIKGHPGWCHLRDSCWLIRTEKTAGRSQARDVDRGLAARDRIPIGSLWVLGDAECRLQQRPAPPVLDYAARAKPIWSESTALSRRSTNAPSASSASTPSSSMLAKL